MSWPEIHEPFRQMARKRWDYVSPYRLGILIGEHGGGLDPPSYYREQARRQYQDGIERGLENRKRQKRWLAK